MQFVTETHQSVCPMDCPDTCSLDVEVRAGRVTAIRGNRRNSLTGGFICTKVSRFASRLYGPDRLLYPQRRCGAKGSAKFERISWDVAIREIASKLQQIRDQFGGESILPYYYGGSNGLMTQGLVDMHFFRRLGASRLARTICAASTTAAAEALYGRMPGTAFQDYAKARFILLWGANPTQSNIHLMPHIKAARRQGAKVAVVDPRRIMSEDTVDFYLQPYPGSDVAVALAMIHHLDKQGLADRRFLEAHATGWHELLDYAATFSLERASRLARVPAEEIARLAENYAQADPAVLRCGWGAERNRNGLSSVAAILALPAVAGKFGKVGGGYTLSNSGAYRVDDVKLAGLPETSTRLLNMNLVGRILTEEAAPPVKALFVYNGNPAATAPDSNRVTAGLLREDLFTVVFEQVMTDTAAFADILLPATTFLEHTELSKSYGSYAVQLGEPAVAPEGEARCNAEVFQMLGRAMGWNDGLFVEDPETLLRRAVGAVTAPMKDGLNLETLRLHKTVLLAFPEPSPVQFVTVFPKTPTGKACLYPQALGPEPYAFREGPGNGGFPLALITPASNKTISSTLGEFNLQRAILEMHPGDAAERGLQGGSVVRVFNDLGEVHCTLKIDDRLRPGVVSLPKGFWRRASLNGAVSTTLVPDHLTPISGGACFNDARVQVEALP